MDHKGVTLLEVMISVAVLTIIMGVLFLLANSLHEATQAQEAQTTTADEARSAMLFMLRELRQTSSNSIPWAALPGASLSYSVAVDADGNGFAVDVGGNLELSPQRTLGRDMNDLNQDGQTVTQLLWTEQNTLRVIANHLLPDEDLNNNGALDAGEDANGNNVLDRGLWFEPWGQGLRVTVQAEQQAGPQGPLFAAGIAQIILPRNI